MTAVTAELRNWKIVHIGSFAVIVGDIYGDSKERWKDGHRIRTSSIIVQDEVDPGIYHTMNSVYLCKPEYKLKED